MRRLELLAPARNADIGIAAIDCGADAVYIAGPLFGARQAAGNDIADIRRLCSYAHRFGARIFVTLNTIILDSELEEARSMMMQVRDAGADAIIVQDMAVPMMAAGWHIGRNQDEGKLTSGAPVTDIPLHASTQCAIRTPEQARFLESIGFSRLILERELSLEQIKAISDAVQCEIEFFVHGALCVCYSGQCYLSEHIAGRSANRGACIQACRSKYDLVDSHGRTLLRNKAVLSLKDYNLRDRIEDLAEAGVVSFKIEGRLKNESYVRNVVRDYSAALDALVTRYPDRYARTSFGHVTEGFIPDPSKTFNRGYTELFLDGHRGKWASGDSAKGMGEEIGIVARLGKDKGTVEIKPLPGKQIRLNNGDGFSFVSQKGEVIGFRGDICEGMTIRCKAVPALFTGAKLYRNVDTAFEKAIEKDRCIREIEADIILKITKDNSGTFIIEASACTEDGRKAVRLFPAGRDIAANKERMRNMLYSNISKSCGIYRFSLTSVTCGDKDISEGAPLPFMQVSAINSIRRSLADDLDRTPCIPVPLHKAALLAGLDTGDTQKRFRELITDGHLSYKSNIANRLAEKLYCTAGASQTDKAYELSHESGAELMRTKYCIRHELGLCPKQRNSKPLTDKAIDGTYSRPSNDELFLVNNGRRLTLRFDCRHCEMVVKE